MEIKEGKAIQKPKEKAQQLTQKKKEQYKPHKRQVMNLCVPQGLAVPVPLTTRVVLLLKCPRMVNCSCSTNGTSRLTIKVYQKHEIS